MRSKFSASTEPLAGDTLQRLLAAGRWVVAELDLEVVLERVLETAADVTGARYAAIGVLDERRTGLERFLTRGLEHDMPGPPPVGRGLLGALITDPRPLRVESLLDDPRASGFPPGHPSMTTFLGVPIAIGGQAWGNLYLCDKEDGEHFTAADEDAVVVLAGWAAIAIEHARLFARSERRVRRLEAATQIARAVGGETDLSRILQLIASHGQSLIGARGLAILLRRPDGLTVSACAGDVPGVVRGLRLADGPDALELTRGEGRLLPLVFRGSTLGMLLTVGAPDDGDDESLLRAFAASAATAVATARSVEERRLHDMLHASEAERVRWARELHDDTLQGLGGVRMLLSAAARSEDPRPLLADALARTEEEIDGLRGLIRELRPAALDELGVTAAIEGLAGRITERQHIDVAADVRLQPVRHAPELETAVYRIVQEAVGNAVRHGHPTRIGIAVSEAGGLVHVRVHDDGRGFDPDAPQDGFGLLGMRERVALLRGELEVASSASGTTVTASLPV